MTGYGELMTANPGHREPTISRLSDRRARIRRTVAQPPSSRRAATQTQLLEAGRSLIIEKGLGATSVGDICTAAGFTRGAFYSNFTDMDHFVSGLAENQWAELLDFIHSAVETVLSDHELGVPMSDEEITSAIDRLAAGILAALPVGRDFYMLQSELASRIARDPEHSTSLRKGYETFAAALQEVLVSGFSVIGRRPLLSAEDTTEIILATTERSMRIALMSGREDTVTELLERTLPTLLSRLSAPIHPVD